MNCSVTVTLAVQPVCFYCGHYVRHATAGSDYTECDHLGDRPASANRHEQHVYVLPCDHCAAVH